MKVQTNKLHFIIFFVFLASVSYIRGHRREDKLENTPEVAKKWMVFYIQGMASAKPHIVKPKDGRFVLNQFGLYHPNLSCISSGNPTPKIVWLHNGTVIHEGIRNHHGHGKIESLVKFYHIDPTAGGIYTCIASNRVGSDQFNFTVSINH